MIPLSPSNRGMIERMCDGNPGALTVLCNVYKHSEHGFVDLCHMDEMGLKGPAIWIGYKDYCGEDLDKFIECVRLRDAGMVSCIKDNGYFAQVER